MLLAGGNPTDSLLMTLRIEGQGGVLYTDSFVVDRVIGFDAVRPVASDEEWEGVLEFHRGFFADRQFQEIGAFVERGLPSRLEPPVHLDIIRQAKMRSLERRLIRAGMNPEEAERQAQREFPWDMAFDTATALGQWEEMVSSGIPVFRYSSGGDRVYSLAWSEAPGQFVDLIPCC